MAQTGFTPIQLYSTSTAAAAPSASNLTNSTLGSELAINITDGKLFYKDNANAVQVIGWKTVPTTAGGTGLTSYAAGDLSYYASGTTLTKLTIGTAGQILTSTGSAPQWSTLSGVAVTTFSAGTTGFTPNSATSGAITLAGTLATTNGGTGLTAFTANGVFYASSTSAVAQSASLTFSGTTLTAGNYSTGGNLTFTGTGNRITGDFSNATQANRVAFQTSTANSSTVLTVIPNGTGAVGQINLFNSSDPANASALSLLSLAAETSVRSNVTGTGTALPLTLYAGGSERFRIDTSGNVGIGTNASPQRLTVWTGGTLPSAIANVQLLVGDTTGFANTGLALVTNAGNASSLTFGSTASPTLGRIEYDNTSNYMRFLTNSTEGMRLFSSGGVSIGNTTDPGATNLSVTGLTSAARFVPTGSTVPTNGMYLPGTNTIGFAVNSSIVGYHDTAWAVWGGTNANGAYPSINSVVGIAMSWNFTGGGRENTFMNNDNSGGGFRWLQRTGTSTNTYLGQTTNAGAWSQGNNSATWTVVSDFRIKQDIRPISTALTKILALKPCHFEYIDKIGKTKTGFIAQDFEQVFPGHIVEEAFVPEQYRDLIPEGEKLKGIDADLMPYIVAAIQEQQQTIMALEARIQTLEK
jgi:hypothetical protein